MIGRFRVWIKKNYGFGSAGFGASGADEIENGFGGFREIGV